MHHISQHTLSVAQYFYQGLSSCHHGNGSLLAEIYCDGCYDSNEKQGSIVSFNILRENGEYIGFSEVSVIKHWISRSISAKNYP